MNTARRLLTLLSILLLASFTAVALPSTAQAATSAIKLASPASPVLKGDKITLAGYFSSAAGRTLYLEYAAVDKNTWYRLTGSTKKLPSAGTWKHAFTPSSTKKYRAVLPATSTRARRVSASLGVKVVTGWRQIAVGEDHSCAIRHDRSAWCWGSNQYGELGSPTNAGQTVANPTPRKVTLPVAGATWTSLSVSADHSCGILNNKTAWCWGSNFNGQLTGNTNLGSSNANPTPRRVDTPELSPWLQISAAPMHTCGIGTNGFLWCWGSNENGQLATETNMNGSTPNPLPLKITSPAASVGWRTVSTALQHNCGVLTNDTLWCWGSSNGRGQIGPGYPTNTGQTSAELHQVPAPTSSWAQVNVGYRHSCGILRNGTARCWGDNQQGQLANATSFGTTTANPMPLALVSPFNGGVTALRGGGDYGCGLLPTKTLWCVGDNSAGQLGANAGQPDETFTPARVGTSTWKSVATGSYTTCALRSDHQALCWGTNNVGQAGSTVGLGSFQPNYTPRAVPVPK